VSFQEDFDDSWEIVKQLFENVLDCGDESYGSVVSDVRVGTVSCL